MQVIALFLDMGSYNFRDGSVLALLVGHAPTHPRWPQPQHPTEAARLPQAVHHRNQLRRTGWRALSLRADVPAPIITHRWPLDLVESLEEAPGRTHGLSREWGSDTSNGARIRRLQFRPPFHFSGIVIRRGAAEAPHFRSAHSPSRPDTLAQEGSSTAKAFLRALAVAFHRSPTSLRWCWTGERQIAVAVSCSHHKGRTTFPRRIPPGSRGRVAGA
jgi:hypothetical protein